MLVEQNPVYTSILLKAIEQIYAQLRRLHPIIVQGEDVFHKIREPIFGYIGTVPSVASNTKEVYELTFDEVAWLDGHLYFKGYQDNEDYDEAIVSEGYAVPKRINFQCDVVEMEMFTLTEIYISLVDEACDEDKMIILGGGNNGSKIH